MVLNTEDLLRARQSGNLVNFRQVNLNGVVDIDLFVVQQVASDLTTFIMRQFLGKGNVPLCVLSGKQGKTGENRHRRVFLRFLH